MEGQLVLNNTGAARLNRPRDLVQSLERGLAVVTTFDSDHCAMTLDEVTERCGFSRSAVRRLLQTLAARGYVTFDGCRYTLTPRLLDLGYRQQSQLSIADVARPYADALTRHLGRNVSVAIIDLPDVVYVLRVGARRIMKVSLTEGSRLPAHLTAIGRTLLAWLPDVEIEPYFAEVQFRRVTARTIQSPTELRAELQRVRENGFSFVDQELEDGLSAIAAPVRDRHFRVVAAINVSFQSMGTTQLIAERSNALPELLQTAAKIGVNLHPTHVA